jgi:hypothetical protein
LRFDNTSAGKVRPRHPPAALHLAALVSNYPRSTSASLES